MTLVQSSANYSPERLAYWYFRLNGFLTTENFIIHPDTGSDQRTDADLLAVRFDHREENPRRPMKDDPKVVSCPTFVNVIIAEVKTGKCALNGPWTNPNAQNMNRVLQAIGCVSKSEVESASKAIYQEGFWTDSTVTIRLFALGESRNPELLIPDKQQLTWHEIISFCVKRFKEYKRQKFSVGQWTEDGKQLKMHALESDAETRLRQIFNLRMDQGSTR